MTQAQSTLSPGKTEQQIKDEGYQAYVNGKDMVKDNPYPSSAAFVYWTWRKGFIEAFQDTN